MGNYLVGKRDVLQAFLSLLTPLIAILLFAVGYYLGLDQARLLEVQAEATGVQAVSFLISQLAAENNNAKQAAIAQLAQYGQQSTPALLAIVDEWDPRDVVDNAALSVLLRQADAHSGAQSMDVILKLLDVTLRFPPPDIPRWHVVDEYMDSASQRCRDDRVFRDSMRSHLSVLQYQEYSRYARRLRDDVGDTNLSTFDLHTEVSPGPTPEFRANGGYFRLYSMLRKLYFESFSIKQYQLRGYLVSDFSNFSNSLFSIFRCVRGDGPSNPVVLNQLLGDNQVIGAREDDLEPFLRWMSTIPPSTSER